MTVDLPELKCPPNVTVTWLARSRSAIAPSRPGRALAHCSPQAGTRSLDLSARHSPRNDAARSPREGPVTALPGLPGEHQGPLQRDAVLGDRRGGLRELRERGLPLILLALVEFDRLLDAALLFLDDRGELAGGG